MKLTLFTLAAVPVVCAHTHITNLFVNGVDQVGDMKTTGLYDCADEGTG
jgi:hypothetical protein